MENANEGRTPALSDAQARRLLDAPEGESLLARRDLSQVIEGWRGTHPEDAR